MYRPHPKAGGSIWTKDRKAVSTVDTALVVNPTHLKTERLAMNLKGKRVCETMNFKLRALRLISSIHLPVNALSVSAKSQLVA